MKKFLFFTVFMMAAAATSVFAHRIVIGQTYTYEWTIINDRTGEVISSGEGAVVPQSGWSLTIRNMETYVRNNVLRWNNWTRNAGGVRQRLTVIMLDGEEDDDD